MWRGGFSGSVVASSDIESGVIAGAARADVGPGAGRCELRKTSETFDKVRALVDWIDCLDHIPPGCLLARLLALVESLAALLALTVLLIRTFSVRPLFRLLFLKVAAWTMLLASLSVVLLARVSLAGACPIEFL